MKTLASQSARTAISMRSLSSSAGSTSTTTFLAPRANPGGVVGGDDVIQARADANQQVAVLHRKVGAAQRDGARTAHAKGVVIWDQVKGVPGGDHWDLEGLVQLPKGFRGTSQTYPVAGQEQRPLGLAQQCQGCRDLSA